MRTIAVDVCGEGHTTLPVGVTVDEVLTHCTDNKNKTPVIAAFVNNEVRPLSYRLFINTTIRPIHLDTSEGQRVYRRSVCYALAIAAYKVLPNTRLLIGHSLGNAYFYSFDGRDTDERSIESLREGLTHIVERDLPIHRGVTSYTDALEHFTNRNMNGAALLVERHNYGEVPVYRCDDFMDLSHGPLAPRTGMLDTWSIEKYQNGFLLVFPTQDDHTSVTPGQRSTTLFQIYQEYKDWGRVLGISSVGQLNILTEKSTVKDFIRVNETLHEKKIGKIADQVKAAGETEKVVLIAGPSSSGKTTFTKKLSVHLQAIGLKPIMISLDDYFVPRERTPRDADGNYNFETVHAIDIDLLNRHLVAIFNGEEVEIPFFNFKSGQPEYRGRIIKLPPKGVLLMEGIHGLNDELTPDIPDNRKFKIYVSALTQLNLDDHNRISTTDNRLIRRMVRDHQFRGHSAQSTLDMWPSVRRGEDKNIFPFQDSADATFNTALDYELGVLRNYAEPLLRHVKPHHTVYHEAIRLQTFLMNFSVIPEKMVPSESILREFIGDSGFHY
ncbi:MAG: nucleoside kinase [Alkalispirochaeta sp.]